MVTGIAEICAADAAGTEVLLDGGAVLTAFVFIAEGTLLTADLSFI
jgi:hypothetical protein